MQFLGGVKARLFSLYYNNKSHYIVTKMQEQSLTVSFMLEYYIMFSHEKYAGDILPSCCHLLLTVSHMHRTFLITGHNCNSGALG